MILTFGSRTLSASATAIAGSTWPAVPPPASTTDNAGP
ncbi:N-acetylglucosamine transferase domain protein [Mycobacterium ulcerans str. Harvey]|uniref:N-acetylglucosamine transferase domain protein n=1 Tax=Mycobacterium ulcerans str. Harvey TaxID=1299332 RepID=A0ABP3ADB7_MYCUL|nr:N-acetylglucosamine transferase domain protein [Mycobacterium ulcerans str. Harvey]